MLDSQTTNVRSFSLKFVGNTAEKIEQTRDIRLRLAIYNLPDELVIQRTATLG